VLDALDTKVRPLIRRLPLELAPTTDLESVE
jgi:hypothetical protein